MRQMMVTLAVVAWWRGETFTGIWMDGCTVYSIKIMPKRISKGCNYCSLHRFRNIYMVVAHIYYAICTVLIERRIIYITCLDMRRCVCISSNSAIG